MSNQKMYGELARNAARTLLVVVAIILFALGLLDHVFHVTIAISGASLVLGIIGASLAFFGNNLSTDALGRWGSVALPQWKWGNRVQATGFALTIAALLVK